MKRQNARPAPGFPGFPFNSPGSEPRLERFLDGLLGMKPKNLVSKQWATDHTAHGVKILARHQKQTLRVIKRAHAIQGLPAGHDRRYGAVNSSVAQIPRGCKATNLLRSPACAGPGTNVQFPGGGCVAG